MCAKEQEDKSQRKASKMLEKEEAYYEATELLKKTIFNALDIYERPRADDVKEILLAKVFSIKMNPYGKCRRVISELQACDIDVGACYWKLLLDNVMKEIADMTNPNKFYFY